MYVATCREIITKAVVGKGKKGFKDTYYLNCCETVSTILGCWVINHKFKATETGDVVKVDGSFDINVWYSFDNDTKTNVCTERVKYSHNIKVQINQDEWCDHKDIVVRALTDPNCVKVGLDGNKIKVTVANELGVKVICEQELCVLVENTCSDWDDLSESEINEETLEEIDNNVNETFIQ